MNGWMAALPNLLECPNLRLKLSFEWHHLCYFFSPALAPFSSICPLCSCVAEHCDKHHLLFFFHWVHTITHFAPCNGRAICQLVNYNWTTSAVQHQSNTVHVWFSACQQRWSYMALIGNVSFSPVRAFFRWKSWRRSHLGQIVVDKCYMTIFDVHWTFLLNWCWRTLHVCRSRLVKI